MSSLALSPWVSTHIFSYLLDISWSPGAGHGNPLQYSCLEKLHGQRSLEGNSPCGLKELDNWSYLASRHWVFLTGSLTGNSDLSQIYSYTFLLSAYFLLYVCYCMANSLTSNPIWRTKPELPVKWNPPLPTLILLYTFIGSRTPEFYFIFQIYVHLSGLAPITQPCLIWTITLAFLLIYTSPASLTFHLSFTEFSKLLFELKF